jgi:hypothetical protein
MSLTDSQTSHLTERLRSGLASTIINSNSMSIAIPIVSLETGSGIIKPIVLTPSSSTYQYKSYSLGNASYSKESLEILEAFD